MGPSAAQGEHGQRLHLANIRKKSPIVQHREEINSISLRAFGDASSQGLSAAVYTITHQQSGISKGLVSCIKVQDRNKRTSNTKA